MIKLDTILDEQKNLHDSVTHLADRVSQLEETLSLKKNDDKEFIRVRFK
jgi:hypothetical protein